MHIYGEFRLCKICALPGANYFPLHDEMCAEEGYLMYRYWSGQKDRTAAECLRLLQGQTGRYYKNVFGK